MIFISSTVEAEILTNLLSNRGIPSLMDTVNRNKAESGWNQMRNVLLKLSFTLRVVANLINSNYVSCYYIQLG